MLKMLSATLVLVSLLPAAAKASVANFTGTWRLERRMSDNLYTKLETAIKRIARVPPLSENEKALTKREIKRLLAKRNERQAREAYRLKQKLDIMGLDCFTMDIVHIGSRFTIQTDNGRRHTFFTDASTSDALVRASWRQDRLVMETRGSDGLKISSIYVRLRDKPIICRAVIIASAKLPEPVIIRQVFVRRDVSYAPVNEYKPPKFETDGPDGARSHIGAGVRIFRALSPILGLASKFL